MKTKTRRWRRSSAPRRRRSTAKQMARLPFFHKQVGSCRCGEEVTVRLGDPFVCKSCDGLNSAFVLELAVDLADVDVSTAVVLARLGGVNLRKLGAAA